MHEEEMKQDEQERKRREREERKREKMLKEEGIVRSEAERRASWDKLLKKTEDVKEEKQNKLR